MIPEKKPLSKPPSFVSPAPDKKKEEEEDRGGAMSMLGRPNAGVSAFRGRMGSARSLGRLLQLRPNEMAFVFTGLGLLLLAPLIEYMVSRSSGEPSPIRGVFDTSNNSFLPEAETPKDEGVLRMAAGNLVGQFDGLVKPLNAPDPTKLIETGDMDVARSAQAQPAAEIPIGRKKESSGKNNWEDALAMAARGSVASASRSAGLPRPTNRVAGKLAGTLSGLQGLSALSAGGGGSGASKALSLSAPSSQGITGTQLQRSDSLPRSQALPELHGGRMRGPDASGGSPASFLNNAPNAFGRPPSGMTVDTPGSGQPQVGPTQGGPGGRPSEGDAIKNPGVNSAKETRDMKAQKSLQQDMAEYNAKKQADLNWAEQQYNAIDKPKMFLQQELQTAGQLANTGVQGSFDLLKTAINPNAQNRQNQQGSGSGSGGSGAGPAGSGPGSFGSALSNLQNANQQLGGIDSAMRQGNSTANAANDMLANATQEDHGIAGDQLAQLDQANRQLKAVMANTNSTASDINAARARVQQAMTAVQDATGPGESE